MAKFPIQRAEGTLPGRAPAVRAGIDVSTGEGAIGQAAAGLGRGMMDLGIKYDLKEANTQLSEYQRRVGEDNVLRNTEIADETDPTKYDAIFKTHTETQQGFMPTNKRAIQAANIWNNQQAPIQTGALVNAKRTRIEDNWRAELFKKQTDVATKGDMGDFEAFLLRGILIDQNNPSEIGRPLSKKEAAKILADTRKMAEVGGITNLYSIGKYEEAKTATKAAKLLTPRERESLLNTIDAEERSLLAKTKEVQQQLINKTTSDTIREHFAGEMTISILNERHKKGLIKDPEYKSIMKSLTQTVPGDTDLFAAGRIRRAYTDFSMGAKSREEVDKIVLDNYPLLNGTDRANVVSNLEDVEAKIIAASKTNAYDEGKGLMSRRFVGIQTEEDLIDLFRGAGLSEEEKERINRRWTAEVNNRDLYERAVDDRFKEMRKAGISEGNKFKSESLEILLQYQRRGQLGLEELERTVRAEQQEIRPVVGPPAPTVRPVGEMTIEERQKELEKIRELKRLAR